MKERRGHTWTEEKAQENRRQKTNELTKSLGVNTGLNTQGRDKDRKWKVSSTQGYYYEIKQQITK